MRLLARSSSCAACSFVLASERIFLSRFRARFGSVDATRSRSVSDEAVQLALPRLEPRLRVLHLTAARLSEEHLTAVLLRDAREIVGARHEVAEGAGGEKVLEVGAPAALVDLAEPPGETAPIGLELRGRAHQLGGGVPQARGHDAAALERGQVANRELEVLSLASWTRMLFRAP
jgi:hypothetical protein